MFGTRERTQTVPEDMVALSPAALLRLSPEHAYAVSPKGRLAIVASGRSATVPLWFTGDVRVRALAVAHDSVSESHACALVDRSSQRGIVMCWGRNDHGQLGPEAPKNGGSFEIKGLESVVAISAGQNSCALLLDGSVKCWGFSLSEPSLGSAEPTLVSGL